MDEQAALAGRMQQERLQDVSTPTPSPTEVVRTFAPPLAQVRVVQGFDAARSAPERCGGAVAAA